MPNCEDPDFFPRMNRLVELNSQIIAIGQEDLPGPIKTLKRAPLVQALVVEMLRIFFMTPMKAGSVDIDATLAPVF